VTVEVPTTPNNFAGLRFTEPLIRQFLSYQLGEIARTIDDPDVTLIEELYHRFGPDIVRDIKTWFREHTNIAVSINYPRHDIALPFISVVNASEQEADGQQLLGDYGGRQMVGVLGGGTASRAVTVVPQKHLTNIFVATSDQNTTIYLYALVRALLLLNKIDFDQYGGMRNMVINGADLEFHPELFPEFAYFKVVSLIYETDFDLPHAPDVVIGGVDLSLKAATHNFSVITDVPEDC
jgi:hypothetical protein